MNSQFVSAFKKIQELFQQLNNDGKINPEQAELFNTSQKAVINYYNWVQQQQNGFIKVELPFAEPEFAEAWKLWREYKKQQFGFTYKPIGEQSALKDLAGISGGDLKTALNIIHQSINKGWQGLFAVKQNTITKNLVDKKPGQILKSNNTKKYDGWD